MLQFILLEWEIERLKSFYLFQDDKMFNRLLSSNRAVVERSIWLLKGKWRRLQLLDMLLLNRIPDVIITACCLHNHLIQFSDLNEDDNSCNEDEEESDGESDDEHDGINNNLLMAGSAKRNRIRELICS